MSFLFSDSILFEMFVRKLLRDFRVFSYLFNRTLHTFDLLTKLVVINKQTSDRTLYNAFILQYDQCICIQHIKFMVLHQYSLGLEQTNKTISFGETRVFLSQTIARKKGTYFPNQQKCCKKHLRDHIKNKQPQLCTINRILVVTTFGQILYKRSSF